VALRLRANRCIVSSVLPPFVTVLWPDVQPAASQLGLRQVTAESLQQDGAQALFLSVLAGRALPDERLKPAKIGYKQPPDLLRGREAFRDRFRLVTFVGACSRETALGALELIAGQVRRGGTVDVQFKGCDMLADWPAGRERLSEVCAYLFQDRQLRSNLTVFSGLRTIDPGLWEYVYDRPRVRIGWLAADLIGFRDISEFQDYCSESAAFKNLRKISSEGLRPHVVLPVSRLNVGVLPEPALALVEATRGGSIELAPVGLLPRGTRNGSLANGQLLSSGGPLTAALSPTDGGRESGWAPHAGGQPGD